VVHGEPSMTQKTLCGWIAASLLFTMSATLSSCIYATEDPLQSDAATRSKYAVVNHTQQGVGSTTRLPAVVGTSLGINSPTAYDAQSIGGQFMEWYSALGRHGKALTFELLLIGCWIGLRIYLRRQQRSSANEPAGDSTATNSLIGVDKQH
jgi:hypothetical protein